MPSPLAEKIKQTQNSFPAQQPGAVAACPYSQLAPEQPSQPVEVKTSYALTQDILNSPARAQQAEEKKSKTAWIEIMLVDMDNKPMPGVRYRITPPGGGDPMEGYLNEHGQAGYYKIEPGNYKITFPDLDRDAWD